MLGRPPQTQRESFALAARAGLLPHELAIRLMPSVGMRNLLVREYVEIDLARVAASVAVAARDYGEYVKEISRAVLTADTGPV